MPRLRIVSLIASATEIVASLGLEENLVGVSHECDYPPSVRGLPACSEPKIDVLGSSRQIDERVKAVLESAMSVYRVHADLLERLEPSLIVTQTQCEVCAVSLKDVEAAVCELVGSRPEVVALEPNSLADVWGDIRRVAIAAGVPERGERLIESLQGRLKLLAARTGRLVVRPSRQRAAGETPAPQSEEGADETPAPQSPLRARPRIACIEWIEPLMAAGNWVPELVELAGGVDCLGRAGEHSGYIEFDDLAAADPDVIAVMPCGFDMPRTFAEMPALAAREGWKGLSAVRNGRVYVTDGNQYFNRPGPRLVESAEILAELLHPGEFDFGHRGSGWLPLEETIEA